MNTPIHHLFKQDVPQPPGGLHTRIISRVYSVSESQLTRERRLWVLLLSLSSIAALAALWHMFTAFSASSFGSYASLVFTDSATAAALWREIVLSLLESLPVAGIGLFLGSIAVTLWTTRKTLSIFETTSIVHAHA